MTFEAPGEWQSKALLPSIFPGLSNRYLIPAPLAAANKTGPARQKSKPPKGGDHAQLADVGKRQNVEGPGEEDDSDHERVGRNS